MVESTATLKQNNGLLELARNLRDLALDFERAVEEKTNVDRKLIETLKSLHRSLTTKSVPTESIAQLIAKLPSAFAEAVELRTLEPENAILASMAPLVDSVIELF